MDGGSLWQVYSDLSALGQLATQKQGIVLQQRNDLVLFPIFTLDLLPTVIVRTFGEPWGRWMTLPTLSESNAYLFRNTKRSWSSSLFPGRSGL